MKNQENRTRGIAAGALLGLIRLYQKVLSPSLGGNCRYEPSCSHFTFEAIEIHGALRGTCLGVKRVGRCQPFHEGGFDPVPEARDAGAGETQGGVS